MKHYTLFVLICVVLLGVFTPAVVKAQDLGPASQRIGNVLLSDPDSLRPLYWGSHSVSVYVQPYDPTTSQQVPVTRWAWTVEVLDCDDCPVKSVSGKDTSELADEHVLNIFIPKEFIGHAVTLRLWAGTSDNEKRYFTEYFSSEVMTHVYHLPLMFNAESIITLNSAE